MTTVSADKLGARLIAQGLLSEGQLAAALLEQRRVHRPLGEILVDSGFVRPEDLARLLAQDLGIPFLRASEIDPDPELTAALDRAFVQAVGAFPFALEDGTLRVAMVHPDDPEAVAAVRAQCPYPLELFVTTHADLGALVVNHLPEREGAVERLLRALDTDVDPGGEGFPVEDVTEAILADGITQGATDIHIEPDGRVTRVRYRLDGVLRLGESLPRAATEAIVSRIKVRANLDISERRRPQDGRTQVELDGRTIDVRVSVRPCIDGENVVLRVLDPRRSSLDLAALGLTEGHQRGLADVVRRPHGLFLVTGPTGSGKTTTLYSMLAKIDALERSVCTIEDPVEYRLPFLRQSQVDPAIDYGFEAGLRALLRQDPDVVLVGEIRDAETAATAVRAAMTGHLVFSSLHTNSARGAIPRLQDLGVNPSLIDETLIGVLAQRLVRKVCATCAEPHEPTAEELEWLAGDPGAPRIGRGCDRCRGTGLRGRIAIAELFLPGQAGSPGESRTPPAELRRGRARASIEDDGRRAVRAGATTMAEVLRVHRSHRFGEGELGDL